MKRAPVVLWLLLLVLLAGSAMAQEWSAAQKEVWKTVEAYNALYDAGDYEGFMAYVHPDFLGWFNSSPMPFNKATFGKWVAYDMKENKTIISDLFPVGIKIHGTFAFVHFQTAVLYQDSEGNKKNYSCRWTDILMKQGDKWLLIGDHGGILPEKQN